MKNLIKNNKISLISGLVTVIAGLTIVVMPAVALAGYNVGNNSHNGGGYYNGGNYNGNYGHGNGGNYGGNYGGHGGYSGGYSHSTPVIYPNYYPIEVPTPVITPVVEPIYTPVYTPVQTYADYTPTPVYENYTTPVYSQPISYNYEQPYYNNYQNYSYSAPLAATCSASQTSVAVGTMVYWNAQASGGSGYYTYTWSGSDQIYGSNSSADVSYNTPGLKYAAVTVYSNGQSVTANCTNEVSVGGYSYTNGVNVNQNGSNSLTVGCAADSKTVVIGAPVTWSVEASGAGNASYSWTGTDNLSGSQTSVSTAYETTGDKTASVTVTYPNGQTVTQACDSPVNVVVPGTPINNQLGRANSRTNLAQNANGNNSPLSAASLFSLANIPWGWVAVLIILVLFGTVLYLLFNKHKI